MKRFILLFTLLITAVSLKAQNIIAVEHAGNSTFYQNLDTAMFYAVSGDIIYLPGASYNIGTLTINKGVQIVGTGCNIDSSIATSITLFMGTVRITSGADNGSIEGIYINGDIYFGNNSSDQTVNIYSIKRCYCNNIYLSYNGTTPTASTNISLSENIIKGSVLGGNIQNVEVSKCIIENCANNFNGNAVFTNNIFLKLTGCCDYILNTVYTSTFQNNIFLCQQNLIGTGTGNSFFHNIFITPDYIPGGNIDNGNIFSVPQDSIFINQTGNTYNIADNYHLRPTCSGKNAGTDATDIGVYGTASPKKDGEIPYNPHIQSKAVPASTNSMGNLDINIKVKAQNN
ncbi:MAG: hypothetical protein ABR968_05160 [Bacteroidales bacterium]|jgi:hypothetical protein